MNPFIPLLVGFIASLGCLIGEIVGYFLGRSAAELISEQTTEKLKKYQLDDIITIPLGLLKYSAKKAIFWCWLGKLGLMLIFAYNLLNLCQFLGGENWLLSIITIYFIVVMVYLMIKIDFVEFFKKLKRKDEN
jgi:membrane protein YqaA with SNARE-associated domain